MGRERIEIGRSGEELALIFLKRRGYRILATNLRTPFGEIDAVTKKAGFIVFVEIKTRSTSSLGPPFLSITNIKKRHLIKNGLFYLKCRGLIDSNWRIDIVSVKLNWAHGVETIELIENAVEED